MLSPKTQHVLQFSLRPQGGPVSLIWTRGVEWQKRRGGQLMMTPVLIRHFVYFWFQYAVMPLVVPTFVILWIQKQQTLTSVFTHREDYWCGSDVWELWMSSKTLMQIDNVHLCCWGIKRARVKHEKEKQMCVKCKQIKADLELRHFNRLHFFFFLWKQ